MSEKISICVDIEDSLIKETVLSGLNQYVSQITVVDAQPQYYLRQAGNSITLHDAQEIEIKIFSLPLRLGQLYSLLHKLQKQEYLHKKTAPIQYGRYRLVPDELSFYKGDQCVKLTDKEYEILRYLFDHHDVKVTRSHMLENIWGYQAELETHTLETHLYRLRQKIEDDPSVPTLLITDDEGYYLALS